MGITAGSVVATQTFSEDVVINQGGGEDGDLLINDGKLGIGATPGTNQIIIARGDNGIPASFRVDGVNAPAVFSLRGIGGTSVFQWVDDDLLPPTIFQARIAQPDTKRFELVDGTTLPAKVRLAITDVGNVGIGTNAPDSKLHVAGAAHVDDTFTADGSIFSPTITDLDSRLGNLENQFLNPSPSCSGSAACIPGIVTANVDGDTLKVYGKSIRFALVDAPDSGEPGFQEASDFIANACPPSSFAVVDEDDMQTGGSFGRIIGLVDCSNVNLNDAILDAGLATLNTSFCAGSEFGSSAWAIEHGCPSM